MGQLKIKELRKNSHLDVKAFHDAILHEGTLPLDVLETHIDPFAPLVVRVRNAAL